MEILIQLAFMLVFGVICGMIANSRGRSGVGWFFIGAFLHCFALVLLLVLPDLKVLEERDRELRRENRRLREQLKKDRAVADARYQETNRRITAHDRALGVDTATHAVGPAEDETRAALPAADFEDVKWYYLDEHRERQGPFDFKQMKRLWREATIGARTMIWNKSFAYWTYLGDVAGLEEELRA